MSFRSSAAAWAVAGGLLLSCASIGTAASASERTLTNPLLPSGADPWVTSRNGFYYYMNTTGRNLVIWKTRHIGELKTAEKKVIWTPPASGADSHDIWAPELHFLRGKWYVYFAADAGKNRSHRLWVIENTSADPTEGEWMLKGELHAPDDKWAIDGTVFENRGTLYLVWSGWAGDVNGTQSIYLARLKNPWTVEGKRVRISTPEYLGRSRRLNEWTTGQRRQSGRQPRRSRACECERGAGNSAARRQGISDLFGQRLLDELL